MTVRDLPFQINWLLIEINYKKKYDLKVKMIFKKVSGQEVDFITNKWIYKQIS